MKDLRNQIASLSLAAILLLYAVGIAMPVLTPIPAFAPSDNIDDDDNTNSNTNYSTYSDNIEDDDLTTGDTDDDLTTGGTNDYDILSFLIAVIECFTTNNEEFSDDTQLCLYDIIEDYFDNDDNGTDDTTDDNDTPSQEA